MAGSETSTTAGVGRRQLLMASGVGLAVAATPSCAQAPAAPPARPGGVEGASAKAFGAIGDGQYHPLSSRFPTLAEARRTYPFAERLEQSIDWAGIQAAIDSVEGAGGCATIPVGRYLISDSLRVPSNITLRGESRTGTIIDNQNLRLAAPQIVNKDSVAFLYVTIRDLTLHGGTHAIKVRATREVAGIVIEGLTTNLQSEAVIQFSSLQTAMLRDCHLMDGRHGLTVEGFPCNSVHLDNVRIGRSSDASIRLRGVDGFVMQGGSIEAGGVKGRGTIDIETGGAYANAVHFQNVYFENTHEFLLRCRGTNTVSFRGCKMTGTGAAGRGMGAYAFDCGDDLIGFADNFWGHATAAPKNALIEGRNDGLGGTGNLWHERSARRVRVETRRMTPMEAGAGLFTVDLAGGQGRVFGEVEVMVETAPDRPIQRVTLPFDMSVGANGLFARQAAEGGSLALLMAPLGRSGARMTLRLPAGTPANARAWCQLDLSNGSGGMMAVTIL